MGRRFFLVPVLIILTLIIVVLPGGIAQAGPAIDPRFRTYYQQHQGMRVLGHPLTDLVEVDGSMAQYFEKGRIEDHRDEMTHPDWAFMYGRLTAELIERNPNGPVNSTSITYATFREASNPRSRHQAPAGFAGGVAARPQGVFVPYDPYLRAVPGYYVAPRFWAYINRAELFPGGWLHDIGLPMSDALTVETYKNGELREITMQAFERAVLTDDPKNPRGWEIERGNIGADFVNTLPGTRPAADPIAIPAEGERVTLSMHLLARIGTPGEPVTATLRWQDGTTLINTFDVLRGEDGRGLVIGSFDWLSPQTPPGTQPATLDLRNSAGALLAQHNLLVLGPDDPDTRTITLYWLFGPRSDSYQQRVVRSERIGTRALEELLWGPPKTQMGFQTAIPTPEQVLGYPGRDATWGPRVTLRGLTIVDGVATANFSRELRAYGGGAARVQQIREQITRTLLQFPSVREVRIAIEGETEGVLEP